MGLFGWAKDTIYNYLKDDDVQQPEPVVCPEKKFNYRPRTLQEFTGQDVIKDLIEINVQKVLAGKFVHFIFSGHMGHGKCHRKGTGILMYDGRFKKVEDIVPGDKVMGTDGCYRTVKQVGSGYGDMYEIKPNKGEAFVVNGEHVLSLRTACKGLKCNVVNISVLDYLKQTNLFKNQYKLYRTPVDFTDTNVKIDPYFLGLWLGDGSTDSIRVWNKDKEVVNYLYAYAKELNMTVSVVDKDRCPGYSINTGHSGNHSRDCLTKRMKEYNLIGNKHIPDEFKYTSREKRLQILAGIIDTDGSNNQGSVDLILKSKQLIEDVKFIAQSLGFFCYYVKRKTVKLKTWSESREYYRLSIIGDTSIIPCKVKRKVQNRKPFKDPLHTGFKITKIEEKEVYYGFELDGNHLYMIDNFIVNHNTTLSYIVSNMVDGDVFYIIGGTMTVTSVCDFLRFAGTCTKTPILLIDEIHSLDKEVAEVLYPLTEDFAYNGIPVRKFIMIGATTEKYTLLKKFAPLVNRCGCVAEMGFYTPEDMLKIVRNYQQQIYPEKEFSDTELYTIAINSRCVPRTALAMVDDLAVCGDINRLLKAHRIRYHGLKDQEIKILQLLKEVNKPLGEDAISTYVGINNLDYRHTYEPFMVREGYISRTSKGRILRERGNEILELLDKGELHNVVSPTVRAI